MRARAIVAQAEGREDDEELAEEDLQALREARSEPGIAWSEAQAELNAD